MRRGKWRAFRWIALGLLLLLAAFLVLAKLAGFGFAGRHPASSATVPLNPADLLAGEWSGNWASSQRDMSGALNCRIEKLKDDIYQAHFDAVFGGVFTNQSTVKLTVRRASGAWEFSGQEDLGFLKGGVYKYEGRSDGHDFVCAYDSSYDKGTFRMKRPGTTTAPADSTPR